MFKRLKLIAQLLLIQLFAKSQPVPFEQLPHNNPLLTDTDSILHEQVKSFFKQSKKTPGLVIGTSKQGERVFYTYGFADTASKKPFTPQTIFEAGSITKTFTANLLLQLQEQQKVNIENSISQYLPAEFSSDTLLQKITLASLLSHSSGLPRLPSNLDKIDEYTMMQPYQFYKREHLYSFLKTLKKLNGPSYEYSNLGFGLLGTIEENITGLSFEKLLHQYIFQPLKMDNSYTSSAIKNSDSATGYFYNKPAEYWNFDCLAGAGAIKSNAPDMLNYLEAHMDNRNKLFNKVVEQVTKPVKPVSPRIQIAYAWHTIEDLKHRVFWHNGGTYGFSTFAAFEPISKTAIILAANATGVNAALDKLAGDLMILLMGK